MKISGDNSDTDSFDHLKSLDKRVTEMDKEIALIAENDPVAKRLQQLRDVGTVVATALLAAVGNGERL